MNEIPTVVNSFSSITLAANQQVFGQGQSCDNYIVVTSGSVKVFARSADGRELVLYRILPGEICVLTTACLLGASHYPAEAITEVEVSARLIPHQDFDRLLADSAEFRRFVFDSFSHRLADLMRQLEQIALESIDERLSNYLLKHANAEHCIVATHQDIATEIGSAREVVSRHLKALEKKQLIKLQRGLIEVLDFDALQ